MIRLSGFARIIQALKLPNYGVYMAGMSVSMVGMWMQRVAVGWLTWELTGSAAWLGAIAFADLFSGCLDRAYRRICSRSLGPSEAH